MSALWKALWGLTGWQAVALKAGVVVSVLAAVGAYHWNAKRVAYNAGYAAAVAVQREAMAKDNANADKALNLKSFIDCHARQNAGEKVIWDRENQTCEKLP
jgi:hypothetical protein